MDRRENDERCQQQLDRLVRVLGLKFVPAKDVVEDGWNALTVVQFTH